MKNPGKVIRCLLLRQFMQLFKIVPTRISLLIFVFFVNIVPVAAQYSKEWVIGMRQGYTPFFLLEKSQNEGLTPPFSVKKQLSTHFNAWLINGLEPDKAEWLMGQTGIVSVQENYQLQNRSIQPPLLLPNDPLFSQQWSLMNTGGNGGTLDADIDAEQAWDITTGGTTAAGDTIVVAVIDGGMAQHPDLVGNLWYNRQEIPGDLIDNDQNGYVDDYRGWNVFSQTDNLEGVSISHGTPVSAIIGAKGNNNTGITGINWNIKIMFVASSGDLADIIAAYDYVINARKRYNASNGQQGAFVVAVNCSWGIDNGMPSQAPLWCSALDTLGETGILCVSATANNPVDVDLVGDLPTTCPSHYQIAVTSLTKTNGLAEDAAWGAQHVDLGAYGKDVYSTYGANGYGLHNGTSFATPHVTGAVGLLYAAPCPNLIALAKASPADAALWAKDLILNGSTPLPALLDKSVTEGRMNAYNSLRDYENQCSDCPPPFALHNTNTGLEQTTIKWVQTPENQSVRLRWRQIGSSTWQTVDNVHSPFMLTGLSACTTYEYSLSAECSGGLQSGETPVKTFKTDGCCEPPAQITLVTATDNQLVVTWPNVTIASEYVLRYRIVGNANWEVMPVTQIPATLNNLTPCNQYEIQVIGLCTTGNTTGFSAAFIFETEGCGSCLDVPYCAAGSQNSLEEWIKSVEIGNWSYDSGNGGPGYQNFAGNASVGAPQIIAGSQTSITLTPGFNGFAFNEYFRVYIDYNGDGDFDDASELAYDPGYASDQPMTGMINVPNFITNGLTRMRVLMKYKSSINQPPTACENIDYGQVEDYCVSVVQNAVSTHEHHLSTLEIYPQPASEYWAVRLPAGKWQLSIFNATGTPVFQETIVTDDNTPFQVNTTDLTNGFYWLKAENGGKTLTGKGIIQR
ncbi:MAG: S8 family serine peptidase [Saprospiraceae bacterium]|nr:S8 family serine peptidase [Saprospiraceae bacterium]